jgi:phosphate butyryltransferase
MSIRNYSELLEAVRPLQPVPVAVAGAADPEVVGSLRTAHEIGFAGRCYVSGDEGAVRRMIEESGDDPGLYEILHAAGDAEASRLAVAAVRSSGARILVKGSVKSESYLRAILDRDCGIRASSILSNLSAFEMPSYHKLLAVTDNAILVSPTLEEKVAVIENTRPLWRALGIERAKVAALAAVETVSPRMPATVDAAALATMSARGQLKGFLVDGPLGYDALIDRECAISKNLGASEVCGDPDMILAPNLETANSLGKSYKFHGDAVWGGLVLGATVPAVLNSRSDDAPNRLNSLLIARAMAEGRSLAG